MFRQKLIVSSIALATSLLALPSWAITLEEATYTAIENNPQVRQSIALYKESLESTEVTRRSGFYPSIDFNAGIGHESTYDYQGSGEDVSLTRRELGLTLTQPIFNGFNSTNNVKRLKAEAEANRWNALNQIENKALDVAEAYTNVLRNRELVILAESNLETHDRIYEQIRTATESGVGRQSDFSQISARLAKAEANRLSALDNLHAAEANYKVVVGDLPPKELIHPEPDRSLLPTSMAEAIDQALQGSPALDSARWDVEATEHSIDAADSSFYPELNFVVESSFNNNIDGREGSSEDLTAMLRLNYNLYNGGADRRAQNIAVQQNIQASEIQRNAVREAELSARLSWASYEAALGSKIHLQRYVTATKESQLSYAQQFNLGRRTLLDVLDSENELFEARQDYVNADFDELYSVFRLFNTKGDLMRAMRIYQPEDLGYDQEPLPRERTAQTAEAKMAKAVTPDVNRPTTATTPTTAPYNPQQYNQGGQSSYQVPQQPVDGISSYQVPAQQQYNPPVQSYQPPVSTAQPVVPVQSYQPPVSPVQQVVPVRPSYNTAAPSNSNFPQGNTSVNDDGVIFIDATDNTGGW
ncbi:TolC family outer membrane protein [Marinomonas atlantica]|uniref:TolC family outer membrane protein n=1 Tax=Marinomonas atlantica TaxID=1806668 RepID=UPI00082E18E1|nr:TolC family outer membrane protein [Marinomonas atlantica]